VQPLSVKILALPAVIDRGQNFIGPVSAADLKEDAPAVASRLIAIQFQKPVFAGGQRGFLDYDDETATQHHGLKNSVIANNTLILGKELMPGNQGYGWSHLLWGGAPDASVSSLVENNIFLITAATGDNFAAAMEAGAGPGITCDYNLYSGAAQFLSVDTEQDFVTWKTAHKGWDQNSALADAMLVDSAEFNQTAAQKPVYDWSKAVPLPGSRARGSGTDLSKLVGSDFSGAARASGTFDVGACL